MKTIGRLNEMKYKIARARLWRLENKEGYSYSQMITQKKPNWVKAYSKYSKAKELRNGREQ